MEEKTQQSRPSLRGLAITSIIAATKDPPPDLSAEGEEAGREYAQKFLPDVYKVFTQMLKVADFLEAAGRQSPPGPEITQPKIDAAFLRAFLEWYHRDENKDREPTEPEDKRYILDAFRKYLAQPITTVVEAEDVAAQVLEKGGANLKTLLYNNTRLRQILDGSSEWLETVFRHPVDLTDKERKKKNGPQDLLYVTIKPENRGPLVRYEFEKDPQFYQLVLDSVSSLYAENVTKFTDLDVTRKLTGREDVKTIAPELRKRVDEAIRALRKTYATLEASNIMVEGKNGALDLDGFLLEFRGVRLRQGGRVVNGYELKGEPLLSEFSRLVGKSGERIAIPTKYLEIHEIAEAGSTVHPLFPETVQRIKIRTYLLTYILRRRGNKTGVQRYGAKVERKTTNKKKPLDAAEAARRIKTQKTKAENLRHIKMEKLYELVGAQTPTQKSRVERDAVTMLKWWAFRWPELLKGFKVRITTVRSKRGRPQVTKTIDLEL